MLKWCNFMSIILMLTKLQGQYLEQWKKKKKRAFLHKSRLICTMPYLGMVHLLYLRHSGWRYGSSWFVSNY